MSRERQIAVAIHDVEPATFERCALIPVAGLHPADFERPGHVRALESVLTGARRRAAVTYDDLR